MQPERTAFYAPFQLAVDLLRTKGIHELVELEQPTEAPTNHHVLYLFPQRFRHPAIHLGSTDNVLALLTLLGNLHHNVHIHIFAFQAVQLKVKFVDKVDNPQLTVLNVL